VLALVLVTRELRSPTTSRWLVGPACLLFLSVVPALVVGLVDESPGDIALSARNAAVPILALVTGLLLSDEERRTVVSGAAVVLAVAALYAMLELTFPLRTVRDVIGVGDYWRDVKRQAYLLDPGGNGLPGNFFTATGTRRLSGSFGDPLAAGYVLAAGLVVTILSPGIRGRWLLSAVMAVALALTFTRAGALVAVGALIPWAATHLVRASRRQQALAGLGALALLLAVLVAAPTRGYLSGVLQGRDSSTLGHLNALRLLDDYNFSWLGTGFGSAGAAVGRPTENVFVTLALQLGLVGTLLYLVGLALLLRPAHARWQRAGLGPSYWGLVVAVVITMVISEQLVTFNAAWPLMLVVGLAPAVTLAPDRTSADPIGAP
jgi:hypothetical protein